MLFYPADNIALFIDGANLYGTAKGLQFDVDYKRLLELFARKGTLGCGPFIIPPWRRIGNSLPCGRWSTGWIITALPW